MDHTIIGCFHQIFILLLFISKQFISQLQLQYLRIAINIILPISSEGQVIMSIALVRYLWNVRLWRWLLIQILKGVDVPIGQCQLLVVLHIFLNDEPISQSMQSLTLQLYLVVSVHQIAQLFLQLERLVQDLYGLVSSRFISPFLLSLQIQLLLQPTHGFSLFSRRIPLELPLLLQYLLLFLQDLLEFLFHCVLFSLGLRQISLKVFFYILKFLFYFLIIGPFDLFQIGIFFCLKPFDHPFYFLQMNLAVLSIVDSLEQLLNLSFWNIISITGHKLGKIITTYPVMVITIQRTNNGLQRIILLLQQLVPQINQSHLAIHYLSQQLTQHLYLQIYSLFV